MAQQSPQPLLSPNGIRNGSMEVAAALTNGSSDSAVTDNKARCFFLVSRILVFLSLHFLMIGAELFAMFFFFVSKNGIVFFVFVAASFLLSGILCAYAAWQSRTPLLGCSFLPLKEQPYCRAAFLMLPLGIFQGVIVLLELEEFVARRRSLPARSLVERQSVRGLISSFMEGQRPWLDKFHCKAVNGAFEGLICSATILAAYWSVNFPHSDPILKAPAWWCAESVSRPILVTLAAIAFISTALCIMELDFAVSPRIRRRMRQSRWYELAHFLFRFCEIVSRCTLLIGFVVISKQKVSWWWVILVVDAIFSLFFVDVFGGCEVTMSVRVVCAVPCIFVDVFRFVDSPYKRRAAQKLSRVLLLRNVGEILGLPLFLYYCRWGVRMEADEFFDKNMWSISFGLVSLPVYWLLWRITDAGIFEDPQKDIFSACQEGDMHAVMQLTQPVGINLNIFDIDGQTPLMLVVSRCRCGGASEYITESEICRLLIEEGARVELPIFEDRRILWRKLSKPMRRRWTALHLAAWRGCLSVVDSLIEGEQAYGASYAEGSAATATSLNRSSQGHHFVDRQGDTPLHVAVSEGHIEVVQSLVLSWPCWASWQNHHGKTPMDLATSEEIRSALQDAETSNICPSQSRQSQRRSADRGGRWIRLPILRNFSQNSGPCRAPGLSSYLASCGGGTLAKAFLTHEIALPPIDENSMECSMDESIPQSFRSQGGSYAEDAPPGPALEDLEPIDVHGKVSSVWRAALAESSSHGNGMGVQAFLSAPMDQTCVLGHGSYGVVWRAQSRRTGHTFAVKNIRSPDAGGSTADREMEMSNHIQLQPHPCIVHLFQVLNFPEKSLYMIVMELCPHGDLLGQIVIAKRALGGNATDYQPPPSAAGWIGQIFLALEHLHLRVAAILRDLKPENVVISKSGHAKLTDFGFGRFGTESPGAWSFGVPPGSPGYIAPESLLQQGYNHKADLYSFGVVIWVLLTGGVTYSEKPRPPVGTRKNQWDFRAHVKDGLLLQKCLVDPANNGARPCPENASLLVSKLTQRLQSDRPSHSEIRRYLLIQELRLPEVGAPEEDVEAWLGGWRWRE